MEPATDVATGWSGASSILSTLVSSSLTSDVGGGGGGCIFSVSGSALLTGGTGKVADLGNLFDFLKGEVPRKLVRPLESRRCLEAREVDDPVFRGCSC